MGFEAFGLFGIVVCVELDSAPLGREVLVEEEEDDEACDACGGG